MRVLVTGHDGYIGSVLAPLLAEGGHDVVGLDTRYYRGCDFGPEIGRVETIECDIRDGYRTMRQRGELAGHTDCDRLAAATVVTMFGGVRLAQLRGDLCPLTAAVDNVLQMLTSASRSDRNSLQRDDFGFENPKSSS